MQPEQVVLHLEQLVVRPVERVKRLASISQAQAQGRPDATVMPWAQPDGCLVAEPPPALQQVMDVAGHAPAAVAQARQTADVLNSLEAQAVLPGHTMPALRLELSERQTSMVRMARARLASM